MLKTALVFLVSNSGEISKGNFKIGLTIANNYYYCTEVVNFLLEYLFARKDEIHY